MQRYLKLAVAWCLFMGSVLTLGVLAVGWRYGTLQPAAVASLTALWSTELCLGALIRVKNKE